MRVVTLTLLLLVSLIIIAFALLNAQTVDVNYLLGHSKMPLSLVMLIVLIIGAFVGMCWTLKWVFRSRAHAHELSKKVNLLQKEIDNLRAVPVKDANQWS